MLSKFIFKFYSIFCASWVRRWFFTDLIKKTRNFGNVTWLGYPIWQNTLDLWVIQETIVEIKPELIIETGTNRSGSSLFYAHLFDLMGTNGSIITIDIEKLHNISHPRITHLIGDSCAPELLQQIRERADACTGPVMVILDSDHSKQHVQREIASYAPLVTSGSYMLVQDGVIDVLGVFKTGRPGPLPAVREFLASTTEFIEDKERNARFLISHHPKGWLRKK